MVGVPKSKGCLLCLQRSVKCDEERPTCTQCRRGGRTCPGYDRPMEFVDEGNKVKARLATKNGRRLAVNKPDPCPKDQTTVDKAIQQWDAKKGHVTVDQLELKAFKQPSGMKAQRDQILSSFVSAMFPLGSADVQTSFLGSWLWHLPPRLGSSVVLDHAASSVAWAYFARVFGDVSALRNAEVFYACAVKNLALALGDPKQQLASNVLCATILLGHYETFVNVNYAWIRHAGGAARLMQLRGPERCYDSAFEYSMFLTSRGAIIAEALASGKPCILESQDWQKIPDGLIEFPLLPKSSDMYHEVFGYFAAIPGLQSRVRRLNDDVSDKTRASLLASAQRLYKDMRLWYGRFVALDEGLKEPRVVSPVAKDYPFHSQYIYHDIPSGSTITTYYAYLIIVKQVINSLRPVGDELLETSELASAICMSVDYCLHAGYCGTQTMRFSLPIALSALPIQYHQWVNTWRDKFSAIMGATMIQPLYS